MQNESALRWMEKCEPSLDKTRQKCRFIAVKSLIPTHCRVSSIRNGDIHGHTGTF